MTNRKSQVLSGTVFIILLVAAWMALAPIQFGGQTAYIVINGNSMWPILNWDDLVILRQASAYQVGDIVAYHDPKVGPVIHRIIEQEADRFIFKGDHNDFIDPYHPIQTELIGKLWIRLPVVGRYVEKVRTPYILTFLAAVMGIITMNTITKSPKGPKNKREQRSNHSTTRQFGANIADILLVSGVLAAASLVLAVFAFTRPTHLYTTENIDYQHTGTFSYSAPAPPGVYDSEIVQTGEPIFRRLIDEVTVNFEYRLATDLPGPVSGTYHLIAELGGLSGWKRTIELQPETVFDNRTFVTTSTIDLSDIQALLENFEKQVDIHRNTYKIAIIPQVSVNGQIAGQALEDTFAPRLVFEFSDLQLQLANSADSIKPFQSGQLSRTITQPNTLSILGLNLDVSTARVISLIALALSVSVSEVLGLLIFYTTRKGESAKIQLKYGSMLIPVQNGNLVTDAKRRIVSIGSIDGLAKIAETNGSMILHLTRGNVDYYLVKSADALYCYRTSSSNNRQFQKSPILQTQDAWEV